MKKAAFHTINKVFCNLFRYAWSGAPYIEGSAGESVTWVNRCVTWHNNRVTSFSAGTDDAQWMWLRWSCGQTEIRWNALFVQHATELLQPAILLRTTTKHSSDIVALRRVLPETYYNPALIPRVLPSLCLHTCLMRRHAQNVIRTTDALQCHWWYPLCLMQLHNYV